MPGCRAGIGFVNFRPVFHKGEPSVTYRRQVNIVQTLVVELPKIDIGADSRRVEIHLLDGFDVLFPGYLATCSPQGLDEDLGVNERLESRETGVSPGNSAPAERCIPVQPAAGRSPTVAAPPA